jgi:hypothetical protein
VDVRDLAASKLKRLSRGVDRGMSLIST